MSDLIRTLRKGKWYKKTIVIIAVILAVIIGFVVAGNIPLNAFRAFLMGEHDIIKEIVSPDGKHVAYVFEANGGATTKFTYRLSILNNGKKLKAGDKIIIFSIDLMRTYEECRMLSNNIKYT